MKWQQAITNEVTWLLAIGFINEVYYLNWLANLVVVPKKNGAWKILINHIDLNKTRLKDSYPLLNIDQLADAITRHELF